MGEKIQFIKEDFDFNNFTLSQPNGLQGGSYFTKLTNLEDTLYIQLSKCNTKQGIVKTAKKTYCDLMFNSSDGIIIEWFENLEKKLIELIYEKRNLWFHTPLEKEDIESQFSSPIRIYKSGKFYLVRVHISHANILNSGDLNCYNEEGLPVDPNSLNDQNLQIIPLIEIQGVKFSSRSFSCEIALKQIMVLKKDEEVFNKCLITKPNLQSNEENISTEKKSLEASIEKSDEKIKLTELDSLESVISNESDEDEIKTEDKTESTDSSFNTVIDNEMVENSCLNADENKDENKNENEIKTEDKTESTDPSFNTVIDNEMVEKSKLEDLESNEEDLNNDLEELKLNVEDLPEDNLVTLRKPNEVYKEIWREARKKAKLARKTAIEAYLEAKNIKATYMVNEIDDIEEDSEDELDEIIKNMNDNNEITSTVSLG